MSLSLAGFKPVSLLATSHYTRAGPGGTGGYKLGANYAPGVVPQVEAAHMGYSQNLWLIGEEKLLTEVGTMNLFVVLEKPDGSIEVVTPPLEGERSLSSSLCCLVCFLTHPSLTADIILPGVTRDSILALLRDHASGVSKLPGLPDKITISERHIGMAEIVAAQKAGTLREIYGSGTAALVSPVDRIGFEGTDIPVPTGPEGLGAVAKAVLDRCVHRSAQPSQRHLLNSAFFTGSSEFRWARLSPPGASSPPNNVMVRSRTFRRIIWSAVRFELEHQSNSTYH